MKHVTRAVPALAAAFLIAPALAQTPKEPDTRTTPAPNEVENLQGAATPVKPDYPLAKWVPANPGNFNPANRPEDFEINMVVMHDIEGSAGSAMAWFQNPQARASSHYVIDSWDGNVYQMVQEKDIAWHAGNLNINRHSVGIEQEGYAYRPGFYNPREYETSARLVRDITTRWNIPRDREHIIGHHEVPNPRDPEKKGGGSGHTDPGPYWDWDAFMTMVRNDARLVGNTIPNVIHPGELKEATVTYTNAGDDLWTANSTGRQDGNVADKGGIYLGTWDPQGRRSAFFNYKFWTSPTMASSLVNGDTAVGSNGTFSFSLLGPRKLGTYTEQFRVTRVLPAPHSPTAFGDVLSTTVKVQPYDITVGADSVTSPSAEWQRKGKLFWRKTTNGQAFTWSTELPINGLYDVYARWTSGASHSSKAMYQVIASDGAFIIAVDQRYGDKWVKLGRFRFDDPKSVVVRLSAQGRPGAVVADALRFVGPYETQE
jgi:hypothetical protein